MEKFVPYTGNPENGDYLDYYRWLQEQEQPKKDDEDLTD